jgi:hypothetical protein
MMLIRKQLLIETAYNLLMKYFKLFTDVERIKNKIVFTLRKRKLREERTIWDLLKWKKFEFIRDKENGQLYSANSLNRMLENSVKAFWKMWKFKKSERWRLQEKCNEKYLRW